MEASQQGHNDIVKLLITKKAVVDQKDQSVCNLGFFFVVTVLTKFFQGQSPLSVACVKGHKEVVVTLIKAGAAVDGCDGKVNQHVL